MARLLPTVLIVLSLLCATGCGDVFVRATFGTPSTFQGTVSSVQLGNVNGTIQVTFVTFQQSGAPFTIDFCGDQTIARFDLKKANRRRKLMTSPVFDSYTIRLPRSWRKRA